MASTSTLGTLRYPKFRGIWASGGIYFIGNAMQTMAAAWMMVELTGSSFLAALVQTAVFLPMFLFSLPAGVLADITDRRRLMLIALGVQAAAGTLLALLLLAGIGGAGTVLFMIFVSGCCTAMLSPAWNSSIGDAVPREELPLAITAVGIAYNAARALGPAIAGLVFTLASGPWNFAIAVVTTLVMGQAVRKWPPAPHPPSRLPAERLWGGMASALRFAWHSHTVLAQLIRAGTYSAAGSALWALLPVIGQQQLGLGATGYGMLMGCLGTGAVIAGLFMGKLRARFRLENLVRAGCATFASVMLVAAYSRWDPPVYLALVLGGGAWMAVMSTFNTATQTSVPPWVRARAVAMHTLCALGAFAIGSAVWGALSDIFGLRFALTLAAIGMAVDPFIARYFPLRVGTSAEVTIGTPWEDLFVKHEPAPDAGPIAVELSYRIHIERSAEFLEEISQLRAFRKRDGAAFWRVYNDLSDPSRYVERFIVSSWADYLHQRARTTVADYALESRLREYLLPGETVRMQHYIAER